ncbi:MAG: beta-phosphoglucomutase [Bacillota bacterium]
MTRKLQAFIFDLDGVITDTAEYHYLSWKELANSLGISFDRAFNEKLKGVSRMESLEKILSLGNKENDYSLAEKEGFATQKNSYYKELIKDVTPEDTLAGIKELLTEIKARNIKIALASASKNAFVIIDKLNLQEYFDYIVDAAAIKNGKPDPEMFLEAASSIGADPHYCIGVEDAEAGVEAIKAAGMFAVGVGSETVLNKADFVVKSSQELDYERIIDQYKFIKI